MFNPICTSLWGVQQASERQTENRWLRPDYFLSSKQNGAHTELVSIGPESMSAYGGLNLH
jgi:hypothetical protein